MRAFIDWLSAVTGFRQRETKPTMVPGPFDDPDPSDDWSDLGYWDGR